MLNNKKTVVALGMSGGVDSSAAASILLDSGYTVFGITAKMTQEYSRCCADVDIVRAAKLCKRLGIEHHIVDLCDDFKHNVIEYFMESYIGGYTPSPCVKCNRYIKFGSLLDAAVELGADKIATGHYVRIDNSAEKVHLLRGVDRSKDQSYFLARLKAEQLEKSLFPLGGMLKSEVVEYAGRHELIARKSRESQELCFVTEGTHGSYIDLRSFETKGVGDVVTRDGEKVGEHKGVHHYTIGQRKGLGIAMGYPVYVVEIDADNNRVVIGPRNDVMCRNMWVSDINWISGGAMPDVFDAICQVRYQHKPAECKVFLQSDEICRVEFIEPQFAVTPGQLAVFYDGDFVLGGGWIFSRSGSECGEVR